MSRRKVFVLCVGRSADVGSSEALNRGLLFARGRWHCIFATTTTVGLLYLIVALNQNGMKGNIKSNKKSSWRRSRTKQLQLRLQWPGSSQETAVSSPNAVSPTGSKMRPSEESTERSTTLKRRRTNRGSSGSSSSKALARRKDAPSSSSSSSSSTEVSSQMWTDKYAPSKSTDLVVAPKKVKEIHSWLEESLLPGSCKFLILVGSPGIGKSAAVQCLAREMDLDGVKNETV